jgi:rhamnosyltransferase subunit B
MRTVLLAWELGGGSGHIAILREIACQFAARGFTVAAALKDISAGGSLAAMGVEVLQAPLWPVSLRTSAAILGKPSSATMGDVLVGAGLGHEGVVGAVMKAWLALINRIKPSLIIGEFAPGVALAARGLVPLALTGGGYSLPPSHMPAFPLMHCLSAPTCREADVVATINHVLGDHAKPLIAHLPQVFEAGATFVNTLPVLDPYRSDRLRPADGPLLGRLPERRRADAKDIFVYLSPGVSAPAYLLNALAAHGSSLRVYAPSLPPDNVRMLVDQGATCLQAPLPFATELCNHRLIIHYGVTGTAAVAVLAGVPQLALSLDIEKDLVGQALEAVGVGRLVKIHDPAARVTPELIGALADDLGLARRADEVAEAQCRDYNPDTLTSFVIDCVGIAA